MAPSRKHCTLNGWIIVSKCLQSRWYSYLIHETRGNVWVVTNEGIKPQGDITVISTMNMGATVQYRVIGELASQDGAVAAEPNLEDSYVWLMREKRTSASLVLP
jgi:hypothetical protein